MTDEIYDPLETKSALGALIDLTRRLPEPFAVLGGWAVYLTTSDSFMREHGTAYLGSRDVDVGFHIDPEMSTEELRRSTFSKAIDIVKKAGYCPMGSFRYCKFVRKGTGEILSEEDSKKVPIYDLFYLYLDMMVDRIHPRHKDVFGSKALDEPILARIFDERTGTYVNVGDDRIMIPPPHLLLASKLGSIPKRQKDDKIVKDACDIYSIIWHSPKKYDAVVSSVKKEYPQECLAARKVISEEVASRAARHLGIDLEQYSRVIGLLK
jgi:hypothetical protein